MSTEIGGVYAAVLVPRESSGGPDERAFRESLEFLLGHGISGVVVNGATGEYCLTTDTELARLLEICRETVAGRGEFLCGIGAASVQGSIARGRLALAAGARALLLPMPHFFPYAQEDLRTWCQTVAAHLAAPILLYNLPRFTTPLECATAQFLLETVPNIVGIKDSSGSLDLLRALDGRAARRIVGDDSVLVSALEEGVCDGAISGVAGVLPELIRFVFRQRRSQRYLSAVHLLAQLIGHLSIFPTPWGLKLIAECRGLASAYFAQPLSQGRVRQAGEFRSWFVPWWSAAGEILR